MFKTGDRVDRGIFGPDSLLAEYQPGWIFIGFWNNRYYIADESCSTSCYAAIKIRHARKPAPDLPVDHPVWVRGRKDGQIHKRCLSDNAFRDEKCYTWIGGSVKHTNKEGDYGWSQYSLDGKVWYSAETHEEVEP